MIGNLSFFLRITEKYVLTTTHQICDDIGKERVKTRADCITAASSLGFKYISSGPYNGPQACFLIGNNAWWNTNQYGTRLQHHQGICLNGRYTKPVMPNTNLFGTMSILILSVF